MLKSYVGTLAFIAALGSASAAHGLGFGNANVNSALGQPLKVEIALTAVSSAERTNMTVRLASPDAFKAAGLDYPYHLSKLKFEVVIRGGQTFIEVTSKDPVNDSFINLLVEVSLPSGRMVREYTFLLDPPDYKPEQGKAEPVAPIEPAIATSVPQEAPAVAPLAPAASAPAAAAPVETAPVEIAAASAPAETEAVPAPLTEGETVSASAPAAAKPATVAAAQGEEKEAPETVTVKHGDTLSKIAAQIKEPDVTLEQMLVALYRANVKQFDGKNMNRIRAGKILTVPEPEAYEKLSQQAAVKEIRIQTANWRAYRAKLAAAVAPAPALAPKQETSGKITPSVAEKAPQPKEPAGGKLVLSQGAAPGDQTKAGGKQAQENAAREEAIAKEKAAKENQQRIAALEKMNQETKHALELQGTAPASAPAPAAKPASAVAPAAPASGVAAASGVRPAKPKMAPSAPAPEPSILDDILDIFNNPTIKGLLDEPMYLAGGGGALVLVGAGVYFARRFRSQGGGRSKKKKLNSKA